MTSHVKNLDSKGKTGGNCGGPCHHLIAFVPCCPSRGCPGERAFGEKGNRWEGAGRPATLDLSKAPALGSPHPCTL